MSASAVGRDLRELMAVCNHLAGDANTMQKMQIMSAFVWLLFVTGCGDSPTTPPAPVIATVTITAGATSLTTGESTQLVASAMTAGGQVVSGAQFVWLSEAQSVATVDAEGRVTAVNPGTASISATAGTVRGAVTITVKAPIPQTASVRFVNWTSGMSGNGGFTVNGQFVSGSALPSGQASQVCTQLTPGATSLAFGAADGSGTVLSGNPLSVLSNENIAAGGDYTLVAAGPAASPTLIILVNNFTGSLGAGSAAVRFISLVPTAGVNYVFYLGNIGATSPLALNMPFGIQSAYSIVPSGSITYSAMRTPGNVTIDPGTTITLPPASANTIALVPISPDGSQLTRLPRCS
jgi:hypothetical protein